ncbi:MAG: Uma2 family endonuclease [Hyphomicrobiaceae bacterium]|nr:Uma2 family endonuclease [Hyphomicrobiaceae bacterium]
MNELLRQSRPSTQAAEGVPRWRWTTAELQRLVELGAIDPDERFELFGGEIVPTSPKGRRHEVVADELARYWAPRLPADIWVSVERQLNLDEATYTDPDLIVRPAHIKTYDLRGPDALLVVEVAASSWEKDIGLKARTYAAFGVREYWVIDAASHATRVHRSPTAEGYAAVSNHAADAVLTPTLAPGLAVRLPDLDLA